MFLHERQTPSHSDAASWGSLVTKSCLVPLLTRWWSPTTQSLSRGNWLGFGVPSDTQSELSWSASFVYHEDKMTWCFSASRLTSCKILLFFQFLTYFHASLLWILLCFSHCFREEESFDSVISICELSIPWIYLWEGLQKPQTYCWLLMGHFLRLKQENNRWVQLKILLHPEGQNGDNKFDICTGSSYACGIIYELWLLCKQRALLSLVGTPIKSGQQIKECLHALRLSQSRCSYKGDTTRLKAVPWQFISQKGGPHRDFNPYSIPKSRVFGETRRGYNRMQDVSSRVRRPQMEAFNLFFFFFFT